jgi:hypothetical protein
MPGDERTSCPDPTCKEERTSKRQILLFNVRERIKRMLKNPRLAPLFHYPTTRKAGDGVYYYYYNTLLCFDKILKLYWV